jgi:hypothetical protein
MLIKDWVGQLYCIEIAYVAFLGGFVVWIDDDPYNEGEPFNSRRDAIAAMRHLFR